MKVKIKKFFSVLLMGALFMALASACSKDEPTIEDEGENNSEEVVKPSESTNSIIGKWRQIWHFSAKPEGEMTVEFWSNGKMETTQRIGGTYHEVKGTYKLTERTIILNTEEYHDIIYYRMVNGQLHTYDDADGYYDDPDGTGTVKIIWERVK